MRARRSSSLKISDGALVGREAAREADRQHLVVERLGELLEHQRRLAVARELLLQTAPAEVRQLQLLAPMRLPELVVGQLGDPRQEGLGLRIEVVEVAADRLVQLAGTGRRPSDGGWTPLVMPRMGLLDDAVPGRVGGLGVQVRHGVGAVRLAQREGGHVELLGVVVRAAAELDDALEIETGVRSERRRELAHEVRRRSARCRH